MSHQFDCIIVGGGPGGYVAAIRARQLGLSAALVEREHLGGICLNWGCIPTKALLRASELRHSMREAESFGFQIGEVTFDMTQVVARSRAVAKRLTGGVRALMKKNGVEVFEGHGRLDGAGVVRVERDGAELAELRSPHILIATGARARSLPGLEPDGDRIWSYREAMVPEQMPSSVLVVGSGAIGVEFASFYRDMGAAVTIVELLPEILPAEDEEIARFARRAFEKQGIVIHTDSQVASLERVANGVVAQVRSSGGETLPVEAERMILAVGVTGNVEDVGLESTAVRVERGEIRVDAWGCTDEPGIYAIGDVAGPPWLAHKANHEGVACIERIADFVGAHPVDRDAIPGCTYCLICSRRSRLLSSLERC